MGPHPSRHRWSAAACPWPCPRAPRPCPWSPCALAPPSLQKLVVRSCYVYNPRISRLNVVRALRRTRIGVRGAHGCWTGGAPDLAPEPPGTSLLLILWVNYLRADD